MSINVGVTPSDLGAGVRKLIEFFNDGNTFNANTEAAIVLQATDAQIASDVFTANATAISVGDGSGATISGNTIEGSMTDPNVVTDTSQATITDNTISRSGSGGAAISADPNSVVEQSGNIFDSTAGEDLVVKEAPLTRTVTPRPSWNLVGWTGVTTAFEEVLPALTGANLIFTWEATAQRFRSFNASALSFLNNLEQFNAGDGVWLRLDATASLE